MNSPIHDSEMENGQPTPAQPMDRLRAAAGRLPLILIAVIALVAVGLGLFAFSLSGGNNRPLYPILPTFTLPPGTADYQAHEVGFAELNGDPAAFQNQRLQVSGTYTRMPAPECPDHSGPSIRWSLVADDLQLNAVGFENLLRLVEEGIEMTIVGTWRVYRGPVGCGKEPPNGVVWYLEVDRILEPNPLQGSVDPALTVVVGTLEFPASGSGGNTPGGVELNPTIEGGEIISPTVTPDMGLPLPGTPPPFDTPPGSAVPTTPLPVTPLATPGLPGTPDPLATPSPTDIAPGTTTTPPPGTGSTPSPGLPTSTPPGSGYPGGVPTLPPSATPGSGYP